jgi:hypothetical protein
MSNENMGKAVSTTAIPGTEISNNLIMSAWIRQLQEEDDNDDVRIPTRWIQLDHGHATPPGAPSARRRRSSKKTIKAT